MGAEIRTPPLSIFAQLPSYFTTHHTATIRHPASRSDAESILPQSSSPLLLLLSPISVSVAVVAEEGTAVSSVDTLMGLFDPPMLRKIEARDGRRGDDFGADTFLVFPPPRAHCSHQIPTLRTPNSSSSQNY